MELSEEALAEFFGTVSPHLGERHRRLVCGAMAVALGRGGSARVASAAGISTSTMATAVREVREGFEVSDRQRAVGGGDRRAVEKQPELEAALNALIDPVTRGDPETALRWTCKSTYELAGQLKSRGFEVSAELVRRLLHQFGFSLQAPSKQIEGAQHLDRDGQFRFVNDEVVAAVETGQPVISVDTKKKELLGEYGNKGREWQPKGEPQRVNVHDFPGPLGKAVPYGVFDIANNEGWVNVGDSGDTAEFAVESIRRWWNTLGKARFPEATRLVVTADCGGSNGYRPRAWKWHLAKLAAETGLEIQVCHYPPGTSKWNQIEHRLFSFISINWRGKTLTDIRTVIELIGATKTSTGLTVHAIHDTNTYLTGIKISDQQLASIPLKRNDWHGEWNYSITPQHAT